MDKLVRLVNVLIGLLSLSIALLNIWVIAVGDSKDRWPALCGLILFGGGAFLLLQVKGRKHFKEQKWLYIIAASIFLFGGILFVIVNHGIGNFLAGVSCVLLGGYSLWGFHHRK